MPLHVSSTMCSSSGGQNYIAPGIITLKKSEWSKFTKINKNY